jgi:hypothetical protein
MRRLRLTALTVGAVIALGAAPAYADHSGSVTAPPDDALMQVDVEHAVHAGTVEVIHIHRPGGGADFYWSLSTGSRLIPVRVNGLDLSSLEGRRVRVEGSIEEGILVADSSGVTELGSAEMRAGTGPQNIAIVLFYANGESPTGFNDEDDALNYVFDGSNPSSVNSYYRDQTWGKITYPGGADNIFGPYEVDDHGPGCWILQYWANEAGGDADDEYPGGPGAFFSAFDAYAYVFDDQSFPDSVCNSFGGAADGAKTIWTNGITNTLLFDHELGHSLGSGHANVVRCFNGATPITYKPDCDKRSVAGSNYVEYTDPFDPMGGTGMCFTVCQMNAARKFDFGVLDGTRTVTSPGTFTIRPLETASGLRLIRIPTGTGKFFDLSFRRATLAWDSSVYEPSSFDGVFLHSNFADTSDGTTLLDAHPASPPNMTYYGTHFDDAALRPGETFTDRTSRASIRVNSIGAGGASVTIKFFCKAPNVKGKRLKAARPALAKAGCTTGRVRRVSSPKPKGKVLGQSVKPGTVTTIGGKVNLRVAK